MQEKIEVYCDICSTDYSNSNEQGGLVYYSYAVCPLCVEPYKKLKRHRIDCPPYFSFKDFILTIREKHNERMQKL